MAEEIKDGEVHFDVEGKGFQLSGNLKRVSFGALIGLLAAWPFTPLAAHLRGQPDNQVVAKAITDSLALHRRDSQVELREINDKLDRVICWLDEGNRNTTKCLQLGVEKKPDALR